MKSKEYFEKYRDTILTEDGAVKLLVEMSKEVQTIAEGRNTSRDACMVSILKEQNQKWNSIARLIEEDKGFKVLERNGFINYWKTKIPGI